MPNGNPPLPHRPTWTITDVHGFLQSGLSFALFRDHEFNNNDRWCVKEAAYKAVYPVVKPTWKELTYHGASKDKKPFLEYRPLEAQNVKKIGDAHVSISHDGEYVYSSVLVEGIVFYST